MIVSLYTVCASNFSKTTWTNTDIRSYAVTVKLILIDELIFYSASSHKLTNKMQWETQTQINPILTQRQSRLPTHYQIKTSVKTQPKGETLPQIQPQSCEHKSKRTGELLPA